MEKRRKNNKKKDENIHRYKLRAENKFNFWWKKRSKTTLAYQKQRRALWCERASKSLGIEILIVSKNLKYFCIFLGTSLRFNNNIPTNREIDDIRDDIDNYMLLQEFNI